MSDTLAFSRSTEDLSAGLSRHGTLRSRRTKIIYWLVAAIVLLIIGGPFIPLIYQSFTDKPLYDVGEQFTLANYYNVLTSDEFRVAALNSLIFAVLSTIVSQVVGALQAICLARTNMPFKGLIAATVLTPLFLSPPVLVFGWEVVYGPAGYATALVRNALGFEPWVLESMLGMALVGGVMHAPITFLFCRGAVALADPSMEEAARSCGASPMRIVWRITIPLLLPAITFSGMINFTNSLESLSVPLILGEPAGIQLLMPLLYKMVYGQVGADYGVAASAALMFLTIVALLLYLQTYVIGDTNRYTSVTGKASRQGLFDLGRFRWVVFLVVGGYGLVFLAVPMLGIFVRAFVTVLTPLIPVWEVLSLENFEFVAGSERFRRAVTNSVVLASGGGLIVVGFAAVTALICYRSEFRYRRLLEYLAMVPRAVPGMIGGIAFLYTILLVPGVGALRSTLVIFIIAYTAKFLPTALGTIFPNITKIGKDLDRSSRIMGADWWTTARCILFPLMIPALFSAYVLVFVQIIREYSMALFLVAPGAEVMSISILQAWIQGDVGLVAAMSTIQTAIIALFLLAANMISRVAFKAGAL
ncbi:MAG: iron ABC transporter permease [Geminicoccaceae bacterium]